jgi:hypothetical protein
MCWLFVGFVSYKLVKIKYNQLRIANINIAIVVLISILDIKLIGFKMYNVQMKVVKKY